MSSRFRQWCCIVGQFVFIGFVFGCGNPEKKYYPAADSAREALDVALEKWKSGTTHGTIKDSHVAIDVYDMRWQSGKKLESYEILREEKSEGPRIFTVKMKLNDDKEENEVQYVIVGIDPLNVFRAQDYKRAGGL